MENKIDISIIIPMYNSEKHIVKAITSILNQEAHGLEFEIIIVDDFSTDNSRKMVRDLHNDKILLVELNKNEGTANARNEGMKMAKGEWIQFLDSDDSISKDLYKKFEESLMPDANCYLFSLINEYRDHTLKQTIIDVKDKRAFGHFGSVCNKFIRRDICVEFKKDYSFEDNIFIIDMMIEKDLRIALIKDGWYFYNRKNDQSKMANFNKVEFRKMFQYIFGKIKMGDDFTKMYILESYVALVMDRSRPFVMSLQIATKVFFRLIKYLPRVITNQNRHFVINTKTSN